MSRLQCALWAVFAAVWALWAAWLGPMLDVPFWIPIIAAFGAGMLAGSAVLD